MDSKQSSYKADILLALVLLAGGAYVYRECLFLPDSPYEALGPAFVPKALSVLIGICAIWILAQGVRKWRVPSLQHEGTGSLNMEMNRDAGNFTRHPLLALCGVLLTCAYIGSMYLKLLGFRSSTIMFILILGISIMKYEKKRVLIFHLIILLIIACIIGLGGYHLFTRVFFVNLP